MCNPNIVCAPSPESTLAYTQLKSIKQGSAYFSWIILQHSWSHIDIRITEQARGRGFLGRGCMDGWPSFCSTTQAPHTGPPQQRGRHEAKSFTTGIFTRELERGKFLSSIILLISQDFKSIVWPILLQLTYGEMCTESNSRNQKLLSGFPIADPDMWVRFHSTELVISTVLLN